MASSGSQLSNTGTSIPAKKPTIFGFFSNTFGNTLQEKMRHALFEQLDYSLVKIEDFLSGNNKILHNQYLESKDSDYLLEARELNITRCVIEHDITHLKWRVNELCRHLAAGEKNKAEDFLKDNLDILPFLLRLKTTVKTPEGYTLQERTAAQIALSAKDVGIDGCNLCLMPDAEPVNITPKKLFLYNNGDDENSPFTYIFNGTEQTIVRRTGTDQDQLESKHFDTLKAMYMTSLMNKDLNLSSEGLTEAQYQAYSALLKITKKRTHTEFVKEEGQVQMLQRYFNLLPDGEGMALFAKQKHDQFSEEVVEEKAEAKANPDVIDELELRKVFKAIAESKTDQDCAAAVQDFKNYLKKKLEIPITTGFYGTDELLLKAFALVDEHVKKNINHFGGYYGRKADIVFDHVIGPIEALLAAHAGMGVAQGIYYQLENGEKLRRDPTLRFVDMSYLSFLSGSGWIDDCGMGHAARGWRAVGARVGLASREYSRFFSSKNNYYAELMLRPRNPVLQQPSQKCVIL